MENHDLSVLILDGESDLSLYVARCLGQIPGLKVHALSTIPLSPLRFSRYLSSFHFIKPNSSQERLDSIDRAISSTQADIILPVADAMRFVSAHYNDIATLSPVAPTPELALFDQVVDKWSLTQFLIDHQLPVPATILYDGGKDFKHQLNELASPFILKLTKGSAGQDIYAFYDPTELMDFLQDGKEHKERYLIQSFVDGHDIRCGVLCRDGRILAFTIHESVLVRAGKFGPPAGIRFIDSNQTLDVVRELISSLNWSGIASVDLRYDIQDDQVKVLEINPRYWGSLLGALSAGVNFPYFACLSGLGIPFDKTWKTGSCSFLYFRGHNNSLI